MRCQFLFQKNCRLNFIREEDVVVDGEGILLQAYIKLNKASVMVRNDYYACFFCLNKIYKFCRESLVKTIVSWNRIFLDKIVYVMVKYN